VSDREFVATSRVDRKTERLIGHLTLVGAFLEDRSPARERLYGKIGDLTLFGLPQADADSQVRADGSGPGRAA
jgi:hypothetical protein